MISFSFQFIHFDLSLTKDNKCLDFVVISTNIKDRFDGLEHCGSRTADQLKVMTFTSTSGAILVTLVTHFAAPYASQGYRADYYSLENGCKF